MRAACTTVALVFSVLAALAAAQAERGQIRGTLTGARGPIPNAEVRVRNTATEQVTVGTTSPAGEFSVAVPAGTYDVFSSTVGYAVLARRGVTVTAGSTVRVDATLPTTPTPALPARSSFSMLEPIGSRQPARHRRPATAGQT